MIPGRLAGRGALNKWDIQGCQDPAARTYASALFEPANSLRAPLMILAVRETQ